MQPRTGSAPTSFYRPHNDPVDLNSALTPLQALGLPCALYDASERIVWANSRFTRAFTEVGMELPLRQFLAHFQQFSTAAPATLETTEDSQSIDAFLPKNGKSYHLHVGDFCLPSGHYRILTLEDQSTQLESLYRHRRLHEQLLQTSRTLSVGEMATTLAHELNQPLGAIVNYLFSAQQLLAHQDSTPPRVFEALQLARSQAEQAAAVIARIREFVVNKQPRYSLCKAAELCLHVTQLLQLEAGKHHVRVQQQIPNSLPQLWIDRVMIEQVLANLMRNAIEAMQSTPPSERVLSISAQLDSEGRVQIRVCDRGCGIAPEHEQQLFRPFFTTKPDGMGAGLAICRSMIELHEGSLYFEANPDGGTCFIVNLPPASVYVEGSLQ